MHIVVLGKTDCPSCEQAKYELRKREIQFEYIAMDKLENWRETCVVDAVSATAFANLDFTHPPILIVNGDAYEYQPAMKVITGKDVEPLKVCKNGVCKL